MRTDFSPGDHGSLRSGIEWRVVQGNKAPADIRLEIRTPGGGQWNPPSMDLGGITTAVFYQAEEILHPPPRMGGDYYTMYQGNVVRLGYHAATASLYEEIERARARRGT